VFLHTARHKADRITKAIHNLREVSYIIILYLLSLDNRLSYFFELINKSSFYTTLNGFMPDRLGTKKAQN